MGCLGKPKCETVIQNVTLTEVDFELVPRNVTEQYEGIEPYVIRKMVDTPLEYEIISGVRLREERIYNEFGVEIEYGSLDQIINGTVYLTLKNNDSVGGLFRVELTLHRRGLDYSKSVENHIGVNQSVDFVFAFDLVRGSNWSYEFTVVPPTKEREVLSRGERYVNETRVRTVYTSVRKEFVRVVPREVSSC